MLENNSRTELSEFGEFGLIKHITKYVKLNHDSTKVGVGDDAAVIEPQKKQIVVTTDMLVEGIHFDMMYTPLKHLGYKALAVNISDVLAMNANPTQVTVSIAVSNRFSVEAVEELYAGMLTFCEKYNIDLVGGDTTSSLSGLVISVTALGEVDPEKVVLRSGAKENDLLCASGDFGAAYFGLQLLEREKAVFKETPGAQPDLSGYDYLLERFLKPEPRKDIIRLLEEANVVPTSMIDVSDGLASEVLHICNESKVGCRLMEDKIPIDHTTGNAANEFNSESSIAALNGGEDYELLFTVNQADYDKIKDKSDIRIIGYITHADAGVKMQTVGGSEIDLIAQGWNAFKK